VTGPTGAGKTTTLYSALNVLGGRARNIMTVEDPVEYEFPAIRQTQVRPRAGLTFATAIRSLLRQDPDVIMIGEIRDPETAQLAVRAALSGALVFSTLHTQDAAGAVPRLMDMGLEPYLLASSMAGVIAQRLVRLVCPQCKAAASYPPAALAKAGLSAADSLAFVKGTGANRAGRPATGGVRESSRSSRSTPPCTTSSTIAPTPAASGMRRCAAASSRFATMRCRRRCSARRRSTR